MLITRRCILYTRYPVANLFHMTSHPTLRLTKTDANKVQRSIDDVMTEGSDIRRIFAKYNDEKFDVGWEVDAAVDAFSVFSSRWTTEILATLYIAGDRRFNEMRGLLRGISSRTLSDKLSTCVEHGLVQRVVEEGPPVRVKYSLTEHGRQAGRLLGPLVAYMKIHQGRITGPK